MRVLANLFLCLFLADGVFSLLDESLSALLPLLPATGPRDLLAASVFILAAVLYLALGIDRRLPKRLLLPPILFVCCAPLVSWLFPALAGFRFFGVLMAAARLTLGLVLIRLRADRTLTLPPELFAGPWFSLRNTLYCSAANLVIVPLSLLLMLLYGANALLTDYTAGFMRLDPRGVRMKERIYVRGQRTIRLAAMIHVGKKDYYESLARAASPERAIVLAEGVSDEDHLLHSRIDYGKVAGFLGLTAQERSLFRGRAIREEELDQPPAPDRPPRVPDILRADLDVRDFRPPTILFLNALGRHLKDNPSFLAGLPALNSWAEQQITPQMYDVIMDDILHRRNLELIRHLGKALDRYETVIIPWGALHMKEIEAEVLRRGFSLRAEQERVSIDFLRMLYR